MEASSKTISVEIVYATVEKQVVIACDVPEFTTASGLFRQSGILDSFAELRLEGLEFGVYGDRVSHDYVLQEGDRVEIYRPLVISAVEARRLRAVRRKGKD